jgi:hypothetical protein
MRGFLFVIFYFEMEEIINQYISEILIVDVPLFCEEKQGMIKDEIEYHWYNKNGNIIFISYGKKGGGIIGYSSYVLEDLMMTFVLTFEEAVTKMSQYVEKHKESIVN